jgi:hypothetical protein
VEHSVSESKKQSATDLDLRGLHSPTHVLTLPSPSRSVSALAAGRGPIPDFRSPASVSQPVASGGFQRLPSVSPQTARGHLAGSTTFNSKLLQSQQAPVFTPAGQSWGSPTAESNYGSRLSRFPSSSTQSGKVQAISPTWAAASLGDDAFADLQSEPVLPTTHSSLRSPFRVSPSLLSLQSKQAERNAQHLSNVAQQARIYNTAARSEQGWQQPLGSPLNTRGGFITKPTSPGLGSSWLRRAPFPEPEDRIKHVVSPEANMPPMPAMDPPTASVVAPSSHRKPLAHGRALLPSPPVRPLAPVAASVIADRNKPARHPAAVNHSAPPPSSRALLVTISPRSPAGADDPPPPYSPRYDERWSRMMSDTEAMKESTLSALHLSHHAGNNRT